MPAEPPKVLEALVGLLIPPACREHVLGDLHERYVSPRQYLADALRSVPLVVLSRIRRTTDFRILATEAFTLYTSFLAAAWVLGQRVFLYEQGGFLRLAIPGAAALSALVLRDAYSTPDGQRALQPLFDSVFALAIAFLSQAVLALADGELLVPGWVMLCGASMGLLLVSVLRLTCRPNGSRFAGWNASPLHIAPEEIGTRAREFQTGIRRRNIRESCGAVFVIGAFGFYIWRFENPVIRAGCSLIIAGALFLMYRLFTRGSSRSVPEESAVAGYLDFHRRELERQRDLLRGVWWWYLGPLVPGLVVFLLGLYHGSLLVVDLVLFAFVFGIIGWLNQRAARKLQREIDALDELENQH